MIMIKLWSKRIARIFEMVNRVAESRPLSLRRDLEVSHLRRRDSACDALIRPKYTFAACARIPGGSSSGSISNAVSSPSSSLCLFLSVTWRRWLIREPLSAFGASRFSVPRQIGNYPLARAVAARLRLIDFFDEQGSHRGHGRPALPFSDETHDRDREKRDARGER